VPHYRLARPAGPLWNICKTVPMVATSSVLAIWAFPRLIVGWQRGAEFDLLFFPEQVQPGLAVAGVGTAIVIWSAWVLSTAGAGTPAPFDAPRHLVTVGPYAWFRNPMVMGTLLQGAGMSLYTGSIVVAVAFVALGLLWHVLIRPLDEDAMQKVFGRQFELYRRSVRCWLPMRKRWEVPAMTGPISMDEVRTERRKRRRSRR
jgi:protein-S-isoprenylcysteine O-methyltransferase Ste14